MCVCLLGLPCVVDIIEYYCELMEVQYAPGDVSCDVTMTSCPADEDAVIKSTQTLSVDDSSLYMKLPANGQETSCFLQSSSDLSPCENLSSASSLAVVKSAEDKIPSSSMDEDSAYMTQPASTGSTPSSVSVSPVSWAHDWREHRDDEDCQQPAEKQEKVQRKSWAAGQSERYFQYHHERLYQSESWDEISSQRTTSTTTTSTTDDSSEFVVPSITPLFSSARRRLGRRRDVSVTSSSAAANTNSSSDSNNNVTTTTTTTTTSTTSSSGYELHRAPSSLFYLQYNDENDDDDDDDDSSVGRGRKYSDMPSSRKISAAAYLPRVTSPTDQTQLANDAAQSSTAVAKRRRRQPPQHLAVETIDEILRRQDSSLEQYYKDTLRQVCYSTHKVLPPSNALGRVSVCLSVCLSCL